MLTRTALLTLTGAGGCGKSRLAAAVAERTVGQFVDGVRWVELAELTDPDLVHAAVAAALSVQEPTGPDPVAAAAQALRGKELLLVIDNCEHLTTECGVLIERLLQACAGLVVLATSREILGVEGEVTFPVPPLQLPTGDGPVGSCESVLLFVDRARQSRTDFELAGDRVEAVASICRQLDGIPLAIELAAARIRVLSVDQILTGLSDRFGMLTGGSRRGLPQHRTLQASVDWSYALLSDAERALLRRLSVFAGSSSLEAVHAVCGQQAVLDVVTSLVEKSLVLAEEASDGTTRFRLLETIRQYAADKLAAAASDQTDARDRHLEYFVSFAEAAEQFLEGSEHEIWMGRVGRELPNIRAAGNWAISSGRHAHDLRLGAALVMFFATSSKASDWTMRLAGRSPLPPGVDPPLRARFVLGEAWYHYWAGDLARAVPRMTEALALGREVADLRVIGRALHGLGNADMFLATDSGADRYEESVRVCRDIGDDLFLGASLGGLALFQFLRGRPADSRSLLMEEFALSRRTGHVFLTNHVRLNAGIIHGWMGEYRKAQEILVSAVHAGRESGSRWWMPHHLAALGKALVETGQIDAAGQALDESVRIAEEVDNRLALLLALTNQAQFLLHQGEPNAAIDVLDRCLTGSAESGEKLVRGIATAILGIAELLRGHGAAADTRFAEAEAIAGETPFVIHQILFRQGRAAFARLNGELGTAEVLERTVLRLAMPAGVIPAVVDSLDSLAGLLAATGREHEAVRLFAAAATKRVTMGYVRMPLRELVYAADLQAAKDALGTSKFEAAWSEGSRLSLDAAVDYVTRGRGERKRPPFGWESLTPAELGVARLVAEGLTNGQIAERLFLSPRTVQSHLRRIYSRLDISTRGALAALVVARSVER